MSDHSPYLDDLLSRWAAQSQDLRQQVDFQKELMAPATLAANVNRLAMRERRRREKQLLEEKFETAEGRWEERLQRIEEWKKNVTRLQQEESQIRTLLRASLWLKKARTQQDSFIRRLERQAAALEPAWQVLHDKLESWRMTLEAREIILRDLVLKDQGAEQPFYVSRGRKQPEIDFVTAQLIVHETLGTEVQQLRGRLNRLRDRLQKAFAAVELRTAGTVILYEVHKQEILGALKGFEKTLGLWREQILFDALDYEGCRHLLRQIYGMAYGLRCIEDIPQSPERNWLLRLPYRISQLSITKK